MKYINRIKEIETAGETVKTIALAFKCSRQAIYETMKKLEIKPDKNKAREIIKGECGIIILNKKKAICAGCGPNEKAINKQLIYMRMKKSYQIYCEHCRKYLDA
ncbi:unnamed protein product [marine sediment metagenome]|uniref:Uncharacterized protein n=1 Tax=marine sediment metagenome TaxID=412755 RepID=X1RDC5_9ZZZZ